MGLFMLMCRSYNKDLQESVGTSIVLAGPVPQVDSLFDRADARPN